MKLVGKILDPTDKMEVIIAAATGSNCIHTEIQCDDGSLFSSQYGQGVRYLFNIDVANPQRYFSIELPWQDNQDCKNWRDAQVGKKYNWTGMVFAVFGKGLSWAGEWFCSEICSATISRLTGGPQDLLPLGCPAELVKEINSRLGISRKVAAAEKDFKPLQAYLRSLL